MMRFTSSDDGEGQDYSPWASSARAISSGTGGCSGGQAAVKGFHLLVGLYKDEAKLPPLVLSPMEVSTCYSTASIDRGGTYDMRVRTTRSCIDKISSPTFSGGDRHDLDIFSIRKCERINRKCQQGIREQRTLLLIPQAFTIFSNLTC
jgi:hypothetical protein